MTEIESKDPEIESDSVPDDEINKENVIPVATIGDEEKTTVSDPPEVSEEEKDVIVSASKSDSKSKTIPKKVNIDDLTEQKLYIDIQQLIETNILDPETSSKTSFRKALAQKYGIDRKVFKKERKTQFNSAISKIIMELTPHCPPSDEVTAKKKKEKRMKRKRKRPEEQKEDENENEDEMNDSDPPTKKRRNNDGEAVVDDDDDEQSNDNEATKKKKKRRRKRKKQEKEDGNEEEEEEEEEQEVERQTAKKKKGKEPYEATLTKLKKLARAAGLANPKMYGQLKGLSSNKKRVDFLKQLLTENDVPITMNEKQIKKIQEEYALKREMADLGIGIGGNSSGLAVEDGVPLSTRRPKRKRNKVDYKTPKYKIGSDDDEEENDDENENGKGNGDDDGEEYKESEESEDVYQPSDLDDDDDDDYE